jgi:hypothetical protein
VYVVVERREEGTEDVTDGRRAEGAAYMPGMLVKYELPSWEAVVGEAVECGVVCTWEGLGRD